MIQIHDSVKTCSAHEALDWRVGSVEKRTTRIENILGGALIMVFLAVVSMVWVAIDLPGRVKADVQIEAADKVRRELREDLKQILVEYGKR